MSTVFLTENQINQNSIERAAKRRATEGCPYAFYFGQLTYHCANSVLTLRGKLPTFYLKQILQTRLRELEGVEQIDNQVQVVNAAGLSSVHPK
jgi:hypothetical protein